MCVKVPPLYHRLPPDVRDPDPGSEIYNMTAEDWWESVPPDLIEYRLRPAFPDEVPEAHQEGRSGGWLCVSGIGLPAEWTRKQVRAWEKFAEQIEKSIDDYVQVYIDNVRVNKPPAYQATAPHGRCARAGTCIEHAADPRVPACEYGRR